jgi:hypothetical protein
MNCNKVSVKAPVLGAADSGATRNAGEDHHPGRDEQTPAAPRSAHPYN